ncbi:MAG: alpha/beta hydrolase [Treponema sp.]|nr:alpha/beta hydrolase [Treponema sp.]
MVKVFVSICYFIVGIFRVINRAKSKIAHPGINLMEAVDIGGIKQVLYFRGKNPQNPVILFIHGGPGSSEMPLLHGFQYDWEADYTIVHWDQRNTGKTFYLNDPAAVMKTMTFDRVLKDAHEVTKYIKNKLNKEKIIVLGHSWGSVLGSALVQTYPDDFSAYLGVGQVVNFIDNERVGYNAVLEAARKAGNKKDIADLESMSPEWPLKTYNQRFFELIKKVRGYQFKYKLATGLKLDLVFTALSSPISKLKDVLFYFNIKVVLYQESLMHYLVDEYDIHKFGTEYKIPVFYLMGEDDFQTPYPLAKDFFNEISSPNKIFFSIPKAGHMTMMDNREEFTRVLIKEILPIVRKAS